jgi:thermitase
MHKKSFWLCAPLITVAAFAQGNVSGRLLVAVRAQSDAAAVAETLRGQGASVEGEIPQIGVKIIKVPEHVTDRVREALTRSGNFVFVEPEGIARASETPNDPNFAAQWHLTKIDAPNAWAISKGATGAPIAIIDSGVDPAHPDLASRLVPGWSFLLNNSDSRDVLGHGTKTAGTVAAAANNALGVAGVSWLNPVMPLVVLDSSNFASYSNIAKAITYAVDRGVRIISISIGGTTSSFTLQSAVDYAWKKNSVVIASAGNNGSTAMTYPAACKNAIAVGATDANDALASFSNRGAWVDLVAPGVSIMTTTKGGGYGAVSGTSFSAPMTAGVAALILALRPSMTPSQVESQLKQSATDLGPAGFDSLYAAGRLNAYKAVSNLAVTSLVR